MIRKLGLYSKPNHQLDDPACFLRNIIDGNLLLKLFFIQQETDKTAWQHQRSQGLQKYLILGPEPFLAQSFYL